MCGQVSASLTESFKDASSFPVPGVFTSAISLCCRSMLDSATSGMASVMSLTSSRLRASLALGVPPEAAPEAAPEAVDPDFQLSLSSPCGSCILLYPQVGLCKSLFL